VVLMEAVLLWALEELLAEPEPDPEVLVPEPELDDPAEAEGWLGEPVYVPLAADEAVDEDPVPVAVLDPVAVAEELAEELEELEELVELSVETPLQDRSKRGVMSWLATLKLGVVLGPDMLATPSYRVYQKVGVLPKLGQATSS